MVQNNRSSVVDPHHFGNLDPHPDPHQSDKLDPDPRINLQMTSKNV
jgi:hypothetical protein